MQHLLRWASLCAILAVLLGAGTNLAAAHDSAPLKTIKVRIGRYPMIVSYYSEPLGGQALLFSVEPEQPLEGEVRYEVTAVPGTLVDAVPVKAQMEPSPDHLGGAHGRVNLPVSGQWLLSVVVDGPLGVSYEDVPVLAGAPPAIPQWLGWTIGLVPLWSMLAFLIVRLRGTGRAGQHPAPGMP